MFTQYKNPFGVTLIELIIAISLAFLVITGIVTLIRASTDTFTHCESAIQLREKLFHTLDQVSESIMQAGADLPEKRIAIQKLSNNSISIIVNQTGGKYTFPQNTTVSNFPYKLSLPNANFFFGVSKIRKISGSTLSTININTNMNSGNFVCGIDTLNDSISFQTNQSFTKGDMIFTEDSSCYFHDNTSKSLIYFYKSTTCTLSSNIEIFSIHFFSTSGNTATTWDKMQICSLFVQVRSSVPAKGAPGDGYRRLSSYRKFFLRNKSLQ